MMSQPHFCHAEDNSTYITRADWPRIDELIDGLIEKNRNGYKMVNSPARLGEMRSFMGGRLQEWNCRAGQNSLIVRPDGSLAPCFPLYSSTCDWGAVGAPRFGSNELLELKRECQPHCFSTLNHTLRLLRCRSDLPLAYQTGCQRVPGNHRQRRGLNPVAALLLRRQPPEFLG